MRSPSIGSARSLSGGWWRLARASAVSLVALGAGVGGHPIVGGALPAPTALAGIWAASTVLSWALSGRRWTGPELAGTLLLVQAAVHVCCALAPGGVLSDVGPGMLAGHLAATAVCTHVLSRTEATLWRLADTYLPRPLKAIAAATTRRPNPSRLSTVLHRHEEWSIRARWRITDAPLRAPPVVI